MSALQYIPVLAGAAGLLLFLLMKEMRRPNQARRLWRLLASLLAVGALVGLALPLRYSISTSTAGEAILLTEGFVQDSVRLYRQAAGKQLPIYTTTTYQEHPPAQLHTLHVFGFGLTRAEWQQLPPVQLVVHGHAPPEGCSSVSWQQQLPEGEPLLIQGHYHTVGNRPVQLLLRSFQAILDSVTLYMPEQDFELRTIPQQAGKTVYTLQAVRGNDTLEQEPLPVNITATEKINLLFLTATPDFENKFLAGWLARNGYGVAMRTTISKNKYEQSFLNLSRLPLDRLTASILDTFDVVISDAQLPGSNAAEETLLWQQVSERGLGWIFRPDSAGTGGFFHRLFPLEKVLTGPGKKISVLLDGASVSLPAETQYTCIRATPGTQPLVQDHQHHILASVSLYGNGRVLLHTLEATYRWLLAGDSSHYQALWTRLLQTVARPHQQAEQWQVLPFLPRVNSPAQLLLHTVSADLPDAQTGASRVALQQHLLLPGQWSGNYWPAHAGWQAGISTTNQLYPWYAYTQQNWKNMLLQQRLEETLALSRQATSDNIIPPPSAAAEPQAIPQWYFAALLFVCCIFLWVEKKLT